VDGRAKAAYWSRDHAARLDVSLDEALRQGCADVLNEPIPQRLLQALQGHRDAAQIMKKERHGSFGSSAPGAPDPVASAPPAFLSVR
jgi:hypothetical protein